jgi:hypothetical protein
MDKNAIDMDIKTYIRDARAEREHRPATRSSAESDREGGEVIRSPTSRT